MADLNDIDKIDLKKTSATQQTAKKIIKKCKNLKIKGEYLGYNKLNKQGKYDIVFIKQAPVLSRNRLKKLAAIRKLLKEK